MSNPSRSWYTRIPGEGEEVSRDGGQVGHIRAKEDDNDSCDKGRSPTDRHRLSEDIDDGVVGWIGKGCVQVGHGEA